MRKIKLSSERGLKLLPDLKKYFFKSLYRKDLWRNFFIEKTPRVVVFSCLLPSTKIKIEKTINFFLKDDINGRFFNFKNENLNFSKKEGIPAVRINLNNRTAGYLLIETQSLIASDWVYNKETAEVGRYILSHLEKNGLLSPFLNGEREALLKSELRNHITLGCDPEFELRNKGKIVPASKVSNIGGFSSPIGRDGFGAQLKLRPSPSTSPEKIVEKLQTLLAMFEKDNPHLVVSDLGNTYPCGGHIHIGSTYLPYLWGITPPNELITLLDDFLGAPTLPLSGKARGSYKELGVWKIKTHGFEYRTPPASIFCHPEVARICLKMAKNLTILYLMKENEEISYHLPPTREEYQSLCGLKRWEVEVFFAFLQSSPPFRRGQMKKNWVTKVPLIYFRDEWDKNTKRKIREELTKRLPKETIIILYGLRKERGMVSTIPLPECELLNNPPLPQNENGKFLIGLPFPYRKGDISNEKVKEIAIAISLFIRKEKRR